MDQESTHSGLPTIEFFPPRGCFCWNIFKPFLPEISIIIHIITHVLEDPNPVHIFSSIQNILKHQSHPPISQFWFTICILFSTGSSLRSDRELSRQRETLERRSGMADEVVRLIQLWRPLGRVFNLKLLTRKMFFVFFCKETGIFEIKQCCSHWIQPDPKD